MVEAVEEEEEEGVPLCPASSVAQSQTSSVPVFLANNVAMSQGRRVAMFLDSSVPVFHDSSVGNSVDPSLGAKSALVATVGRKGGNKSPGIDIKHLDMGIEYCLSIHGIKCYSFEIVTV